MKWINRLGCAFVALLLCLAMVFGLVSCDLLVGDGEESTTTQKQPDPKPNPDETPDETPDENDDENEDENSGDEKEPNELAPLDGYAASEEITDHVRLNVGYTDANGQKQVGDIVIKLDATQAPITVANFQKLVSENFYDGLTFHRVYKGFMIQGGDPKGDGTGNSGTTIKGEFSANGVQNHISHVRGVISMARGSYSMDSASCQFFIVHEDSTFLDGQYAGFGQVVYGMDTVDGIANTPVTYNFLSGERTVPLDQVTINSASFVTPVPDNTVAIHHLTSQNYGMVKNFMFGKFGDLADLIGLDDEEFNSVLKKTLIVAFSYCDMFDRLFTIDEPAPYSCSADFLLLDGYKLNDYNISTMLLLLSRLRASSCLHQGLDAESMAEFGLNKNVYYLTFDSPVNDANGDTYYLPNTLFISQKTERDTYYIASTAYDVIVEVDASALAFLEWKESDWYSQYFFQYNIAYTSSMSIQIGDKKYDFLLNNLYSYAFYESANGVMTRINLDEGGSLALKNGVLYYSDSTVQNKPVTVFDLQKGDFYIRLDPQGGGDPIYHPYYKYLVTQDRNGELAIKITERLDDGTEQSYEYALGNKSDAAMKYNYRMVYKAENGEEFDVVGSYNVANDQRVSAYYQLAYWVEDADGNWTHRQTPNLATNLMLCGQYGKLYQIPVSSANLMVSCDQMRGATIATDDFRALFKKFLMFSMEGMIDADAFQKEYGMTPAAFVKANDAYATFRYSIRDMADNMNLMSYPKRTDSDSKSPVAEERLWTDPNVQDIVVRLYPYSAMKSIITISTNAESEPVAMFYVLTDYCNEILDAVDAVLTGELKG